jgi:hypothetical protein
MKAGDTVYVVEASPESLDLHDRNPVVEARLIQPVNGGYSLLVEGREMTFKSPGVFPSRELANAAVLRLLDGNRRGLQAQIDVIEGRKALFQELYT